MTTSIVTGGAGFLGSHLCDRLLAEGHQVVCVDNLDTGTLENLEHLRDPAFSFVQHDLTQHLEFERPVDFVFHLASPASPIDYLRLPLHTLKVGSYGTHNALGLAKRHRAAFLLASTSEVYGDPQQHPQSETYWGHVNPIGPRGVYDEAKRYAEALTMAYHRQQGVDTHIVRIFNSILSDEQVLYDDGRELRRERVADLAARLATRAVAAGYRPKAHPPADTLLNASCTAAIEYPLTDTTVPAFSADGTIGAAHASALVGHPTNQPCYEVTTRYGRSIRVTGDHSIFVEGADGEPLAKPVREIEIGDAVAIARRIDVPERDRRWVSTIAAWERVGLDPVDLIAITDDLLRLLGLFVADGCRREQDGRVGASLASSPVDWPLLSGPLDLLGFEAGRSHIPGWILGLPLSRLKWFMEGYRAGAGVRSDATVDADHELTAGSEDLKDDLVVAFARFGIVPSVSRDRGAEPRASWRLTIAAPSPWSPLEWDRGVRQPLDARTHGDLVWARVTGKTEIPATPLVYDFSVPGLENFWAGTGVCAANTYGPRMRPHDGRAIPTFLDQAMRDKPLTVFGDGSQTRSFCYVSDEIEGLWRLIQSDYHEPVNIGNPAEYTILQLAHAVQKATGSVAPIVFEALPQDDPTVRQPDIRLARELLGWEPTIGLSQGLERTLAWLGWTGAAR